MTETVTQKTQHPFAKHTSNFLNFTQTLTVYPNESTTFQWHLHYAFDEDSEYSVYLYTYTYDYSESEPVYFYPYDLRPPPPRKLPEAAIASIVFVSMALIAVLVVFLKWRKRRKAYTLVA